MKKRLPHLIASSLGLLLFGAAVVILFHELRHTRYSSVVDAVGQISRTRLWVALALTALDYAILTGYDVLALRYVHASLPYRKVGPASFTAFAFTHNLGLGPVSGGAIRYRFYSLWGLRTGDIARIIVFCSTTFGLGYLLVGGASFIWAPTEHMKILSLPLDFIHPLGIGLLGVVAVYLVLTLRRRHRRFRLGSWALPLPSFRLAVVQLAVATADLLTVTGVIYTILPPMPTLSYFHFTALYMIALMIGLASNVPGGVGVFETVLMLLLSPHLGKAHAFGSLLVFRCVYFLLPLIIASVSLGGYEIYHRRRRARAVVQPVEPVPPAVAPSTACPQLESSSTSRRA